MNDQEIQEWKTRLSNMSQEELARLYRFSPAGHPVFDSSLSLYEHFRKVFKGMTPELSKKIGLQ